MLIVISPAKSLDFTNKASTSVYSDAVLLDQATLLVEHLRLLSPLQLSKLMSLSDQLAQLNVARFGSWSLPFTLDNAKQALFAFQGDVYQGFDAGSIGKVTLNYAQKNLRILSGLYGLLKPLDLIQPYRLEMGTKLKNERGKHLYDFWGDLITDQLNRDIKAIKSNYVLNLASNEYFKSVKSRSLIVPVVQPVFKDEKNGQFKIISFYAKKARGMMARFVVEHKVKKVDELQAFNEAGYWYDATLSTELSPVFCRNSDAA